MYILVVVDRFSKIRYFTAMVSTLGEALVNAFVIEVYRLYGILSFIVLNKGI